MTDTTVSDAVVFPEDDGTGVTDGSEDYNSAGYFGLLCQSIETEYVANGLDFANIDTTNENVDVTAGHAFLSVSSVTVQSGSQTSYDVTLPDPMTTVVILPTNVADLALDTDAVNDVYLAFDPSSNDSVYIRHGSAVSAPADPSIKLGTVNTSDGTTTRANDGGDVGARIFRGEDGNICGKTLESGESLTIESDESMVVSEQYTVNGDLTVNGSLTVI